jgi:hypothetical protein
MHLSERSNGNSKPIAINNDNNKIIYLTDGDEHELPEKSLEELKNSKFTTKQLSDIKLLLGKLQPTKEMKGSFMLYPDKNKTCAIYIAGQKGSGKTTWISNYMANYLKIHKDKKIFLFSDVETDPLLDKYPVTRIKLNDSLAKKPIPTTLLKNSLVIFDDIDSISVPKIKKAVITLHDAIFKKGSSHEGIDVIVTNHALTDYRDTRNVIINCDYLVYFNGVVNLDNLLKKLGVSKEQGIKINSINSRWYLIHKNYPKFVITEHDIILF